MRACAAGHNVLSAASFDPNDVFPASCETAHSVSRFNWKDCFPVLVDGLPKFDAPRIFDALKAENLEDARGSSPENARGVVRKLHVDWGHGSARQLKRSLLEAGGTKKRPLELAGEVVGRCETWQAFDAATHLPVAGTWAAFSRDGEIQVDLSFLGDVIALRATEM